MHIHIMTHPDWVLKHKKKGTLIMKRDDRYYLYRVSSHWNKEKKRSQLRTDEYLMQAKAKISFHSGRRFFSSLKIS